MNGLLSVHLTIIILFSGNTKWTFYEEILHNSFTFTNVSKLFDGFFIGFACNRMM